MENPKFCKDCFWFRKSPAPAALEFGDCTRAWNNLVSGEAYSAYPRKAWQARKEYCGVTGEGWEPKELLEEYDS